MLVYGLSLLAGLSILIFAPIRRDWSIAETICGSLAPVCITVQYIVLPDYRSRLGHHYGGDYGDTIGRYTVWLYLSFAIAVLIAFFAVARLRSFGVNSFDITKEKTPGIVDRDL